MAATDPGIFFDLVAGNEEGTFEVDADGVVTVVRPGNLVRSFKTRPRYVCVCVRQMFCVL